jgi:hypothetical protein
MRCAVTPKDFRRIAIAMPDAVEASHSFRSEPGTRRSLVS